MIILSIPNIKNFMSNLFVKDIFDSWLVSEITISTHTTFSINGKLNKEFFTDEELSDIPNHENSSWQLLRPLCFELIRGSKTPLFMKLIFKLPKDDTEKLTASAGSSFAPEDVNGLFINIKYEQGRLVITTGSSLKTFSPDRSLDEAFDQYVKSFLTQHSIEYDNFVSTQSE